MESNVRQKFYKVRIKDILEGNYVKMPDWNPNYIETKNNRKISRVNIIGSVISTDSGTDLTSITIDDGTGIISIRSFENKNVFNGVDIGNVVFVIGRPRKFSDEIYILHEITKKVNDKKWVELRKLELKLDNLKRRDAVKKDVKEEIIKEDIVLENKEKNNGKDIYGIIKKLDSGDGADIEKVISESGKGDAEKEINLLLEEGEIFEIKPGKLKVLE